MNHENQFLDKTGKSVFGEPEAVDSGHMELREKAFASNPEVHTLATKVVEAVRAANGGTPEFGGMHVETLHKTATLAMRADASNKELRFRPGSRLRTYTGVRNQDGSLKDETYKGEATVGEGHTIYRNTDPVMYPDDWKDEERRGQPIRGNFAEDGSFTETPEGSETLYNEYVSSDPEHPMRKYGITPTPGAWTEGAAQIPSYLIEIPASVEATEVYTAGGKAISVRGGDFLVVEDLGKGDVRVQAVERSIKEKTYK
jgi:hypothetical protein